MRARRTPPPARLTRGAVALVAGAALGLAGPALHDREAPAPARSGAVVDERPGGGPDGAPDSAPDGAPDSAPDSGVTSRPVRLRVPRIGVDTGLLRLGLTAHRELEVPPMGRADTAGWYDASPVPGDTGPSVLAGHVDTRTGPAVFHRLRELRRGDRVVVDRSDGGRATFTVDRVAVVAKSAFPTRRVYGATARPELRLITCGGTFDRATDDYLANLVVFAHLTRLTHP